MISINDKNFFGRVDFSVSAGSFLSSKMRFKLKQVHKLCNLPVDSYGKGFPCLAYNAVAIMVIMIKYY